MQVIETDFVVIGSGIAGLRAALELRSGGRVLVLTKDEVRESATSYAQGGIAAAMGEDDSFELHEHDTLVAGDGLCEPEAVHVLVEEGPRAIEDLLGWGAAFDRNGSELQRTREGAHSRSRILHAHGDSTGREIADTLARRASAERAITIHALAQAARLMVSDGEVTGVEFVDLQSGEHKAVRCTAVLLAAGGAGQVFSDTTNPSIATGDGAALGYRAGAQLADMEFIQFHPTALALAGAPRFLLSEALRGEGAYLRNPAGERFMQAYHPNAELAPRDIVSRAIEMELRKAASSNRGGGPLNCFLDATHISAEHLARRFPRIGSTLRAYGLELARDWIPVRPAAHYIMGGVWTDLQGHTSLRRLYAAGETACTGVHGANRLASNSLLEGLVFGARAGRAMVREARRRAGASPSLKNERGDTQDARQLNEAVPRLQTLMWKAAGIIRNGEDMAAALERLQGSFPAAEDCATNAGPEDSRTAIEWCSLRTVAETILTCALAREESRGAHFREDFPQRNPELDGHHSFLQRGKAVQIERADRQFVAAAKQKSRR
jgi:L-aspartate oxidase